MLAFDFISYQVFMVIGKYRKNYLVRNIRLTVSKHSLELTEYI